MSTFMTKEALKSIASRCAFHVPSNSSCACMPCAPPLAHACPPQCSKESLMLCLTCCASDSAQHSTCLPCAHMHGKLSASTLLGATHHCGTHQSSIDPKHKRQSCLLLQLRFLYMLCHAALCCALINTLAHVCNELFHAAANEPLPGSCSHQLMLVYAFATSICCRLRQATTAAAHQPKRHVKAYTNPVIQQKLETKQKSLRC